MEFICKTNPDVWLKINDNSPTIILIKKVDDKTVEVTLWNLNRKFTKEFPLEKFHPIPENRQKPLPTKN